jgi:hypothetical protein
MKRENAFDMRRRLAATGQKTYQAEEPCKRGHLGLRRVDSGACVECYKETRAPKKTYDPKLQAIRLDLIVKRELFPTHQAEFEKAIGKYALEWTPAVPDATLKPQKQYRELWKGTHFKGPTTFAYKGRNYNCWWPAYGDVRRNEEDQRRRVKFDEKATPLDVAWFVVPNPNPEIKKATVCYFDPSLGMIPVVNDHYDMEGGATWTAEDAAQ